MWRHHIDCIKVVIMTCLAVRTCLCSGFFWWSNLVLSSLWIWLFTWGLPRSTRWNWLLFWSSLIFHVLVGFVLFILFNYMSSRFCLDNFVLGYVFFYICIYLGILVSCAKPKRFPYIMSTWMPSRWWVEQVLIWIARP